MRCLVKKRIEKQYFLMAELAVKKTQNKTNDRPLTQHWGKGRLTNVRGVFSLTVSKI